MSAFPKEAVEENSLVWFLGDKSVTLIRGGQDAGEGPEGSLVLFRKPRGEPFGLFIEGADFIGDRHDQAQMHSTAVALNGELRVAKANEVHGLCCKTAKPGAS